MVPTNFESIRLGQEKSDKRNKRSAEEGGSNKTRATDGKDVALDSVDGVVQVSQFTDLSDPWGKLEEPTMKEDEKVRELLGNLAD